MSLKEDAFKAIQSLDNRGILNSIISKNDYSVVLPFLEKIGIKHYFVLPAINWGSKSENIKKLSSGLNISLDAFAFIDDNPHELREVKANCPQVRVYSAQDLNRIIDLPEFNPPLSKFSKGRREQYQAEIERKRLYLSSCLNDYQEYLRQLNIQLQVRPIESTSVFERCYELVARSNQYNLRTVRYSQSEFQQLVMRSKAECFAVSAKDLYGNYGIICFFSLEFENYTCKVLDLVFSCRIARKKIESEIIESIQEYSIRKGCSKLQLTLIRTPKNTPLMSVLDALPFVRKDIGVQIEYSVEKPYKIITKKIASVEFLDD